MLVEQEVAASDRSVLEDVLAADATRTELLREEADLFGALEAGDGDAAATTARLVAVADELEAIGADGAESRARAILCGLGFTDAMVRGGAAEGRFDRTRTRAWGHLERLRILLSSGGHP